MPTAADETASPTLADALARALAAPPPYARAVATDADGTLWSRDVGDALFLAAGARGLFRGDGLAKLRAHAARLLGPEREHDAPGAIADALFARYGAGEIDVRVMCDLEAETLGDRPESELAALIDDVAADVARTAHPAVRTLLAQARAAGATIHVVTGSLGRAVEATLRRAAIPFDRVSGAVLRVERGHAAATLAAQSPLFEGKVRALGAAGGWPAALGLGDGGWDHTFLREVFVPVLVHPKPALEAHMADVSRRVIYR